MTAVRLWSMVLAQGMAAAACGGGGDPSAGEVTETPTVPATPEPTTEATPTVAPTPEPTEEPTPTAAVTPTPTPTVEPVDLSGETVTILVERGVRPEAVEASLAGLVESTGLELEIVDGNGAGALALPELIAAGNPPDIALVGSAAGVRQLCADGDAVPLADEVTAVLESRIEASWWNTFVGDGGPCAVPVSGDTRGVLWYDTDLFAARNWQPPSSWSELESLAAEMRSAGVTPLCVGLEASTVTGFVFTDWMEAAFVGLHGSDLYRDWVAREIPFDDPRVVEAAEAVVDLWSTPGNVAGGRDAIATTNFRTAVTDHADGECAMHRQATFAVFIYSDAGAVDGPAPRIGATRFPTPGSAPGDVVNVTSAVALSEEPAARAVIAHLATTDAVEARRSAEGLGYYSPDTGADIALFDTAIDVSLAGLVRSVAPVVFDASDQMPFEVNVAWWELGTAYVAGDIGVEEFVAGVEAAWPS